jgi:hypothetical protein
MSHGTFSIQVASRLTGEGPTDFLTPEQRLDAVAEILATIALRAIREDHESHPDQE